MLARLAPHLATAPSDLFQAQAWTWAAALGRDGGAPGPLAAPIAAAGSVLRDGLVGDDPIALLRDHFHAATSGALDLDSTLRSHPFADLLAWSLRAPFAA